jgi:hypothetical protein
MKLSFSTCAVVLALCLVLLVQHAQADVYLMIPRGSNNRLNEQSAARTNGNRMFDSQNNNRGGYNVGDKTEEAFTTDDPEEPNPDNNFDWEKIDPDANNENNRKQYQEGYFAGSELAFEWTNQHGCGGNEANDPHKDNCNIVIQFMCDVDDENNDRAMDVRLRNGGTTNTPDEPDTYAETDPDDDDGDADTGRQESKAWYYSCKKRQRNGGLFTADQNLKEDKARYTRQNNNGNQNGLECPEERDYFPYWDPSPWIDIAYLTTNTEHCAMVEKHSQNVADTWKCTGLIENDQDSFITQVGCEAAGGVWKKYKAKKAFGAPYCGPAGFNRVNHHGNEPDSVEMSNYTWSIPTWDQIQKYPGMKTYGNTFKSVKCVARLRYNISTDDYDPMNTNASHNEILHNNPTVPVGARQQGLQLAINTAQFGRTFEDRSHTFYVVKAPTSKIASADRIVNLNVRGKRGNIVQTYPAVEYDFVPNKKAVAVGTWIHVQWTGSNTHNNGNPGGDGQTGDDGQGQTGTDRNNMVLMKEAGANFPIPMDKKEFDDINLWKHINCYTMDGVKVDWGDCAVILATSGYGRKLTDDFTDFDVQMNNAPASLVGGMLLEILPSAEGKKFHYMASRNNNLTNRSQKAYLRVMSEEEADEAAANAKKNN